MEATAMAAVAAAHLTGLTVQMCALLLWGTPGGAAAAAAGHPPTAHLQRLTEVEWDAYNEVDHRGPGTYAFGYDVEDPETGNTQFRQEERHPNGTVTGSYGLVLPDGSVQIVHYTADNLGYRARIETKPARQRGLQRPGALSPPATPPFAAPTAGFQPYPGRAFAGAPYPARSFAGPPPPPAPPTASPARFAPQPRAPPTAYEPVFWLPARAAPQPFAGNYV